MRDREIMGEDSLVLGTVAVAVSDVGVNKEIEK